MSSKVIDLEFASNSFGYRPLQFDSFFPITWLDGITVPHGFIHYIFVDYLSHVRSCDGTCEHDTIEKIALFSKLLAHMCTNTIVWTNNLHLPVNTLSIRGVCIYHL